MAWPTIKGAGAFHIRLGGIPKRFTLTFLVREGLCQLIKAKRLYPFQKTEIKPLLLQGQKTLAKKRKLVKL
ncbi:hypothetical protein AMJ44_09535 [candidate division WOR-1 bacterium DG_54_3]|uniref:Uncharacterized protein n=1 Tax=candidate division WOR-1 bacterium DG_54_3 TaxID=1703775 RepID=A0A0S7XTC3_UNCSA|nr:MAG: hypothetical protein AMJ44_09535 [candidate division WOR-1 bacterium DG_54_3]